MKVSISISCGKNAVNHNNRKTFAQNVDKSRSHLNVTYEKNDIQRLYNELFEKAWSEYLSQRPPSAKKKQENNYLNYLINLKNRQKPFYEVVVQVGNRYNCGVGLPGEEIALKILDEYARDFKRRNPHLAVLNMVLHRDEDTPHLHIDYIPVGDGYDKGLQKRNSLYRALEQQGIAGDKSKYNSKTANWYKSEKIAIAKIMEKYGWEPEIDSELHLHHKTVEAYKTIIQIVKNEVSVLPEQIKKEKYPFNKEKVIVRADDLEKLEERAKLSIVNAKTINEISKSLKEKEKILYEYATYAQLGVAILRQREIEKSKKSSQLQAEYDNSERSKEGHLENKRPLTMEEWKQRIREAREKGRTDSSPQKTDKKEKDQER